MSTGLRNKDGSIQKIKKKTDKLKNYLHRCF